MNSFDHVINEYFGFLPSIPAALRKTQFYQNIAGHHKARDLDVEAYNSMLVAYPRKNTGDHAASAMKLLDRMESLAEEPNMPSIIPNRRSYGVALGVISASASRADTLLGGYYGKRSDGRGKKKKWDGGRRDHRGGFNRLHAGRAAESILSRMLSRDLWPDAYSIASVLNAYQRIPNGRLDVG